MARRAKALPHTELETLTHDIAERFKDVPWDLFDSKDLGASGETRYMVSRIQSDLMKVADKDEALAGRIWDAHVPAFVARPAELPPREPEATQENSIQPGRARRRRLQPEAFLDQPLKDNKAPAAGETALPAGQQPQTKSMPPVAEQQNNNDPDDEKAKRLLDGLEKQYLKADARYHFRDRGREVAFEAQDKKLLTQFDTPTVVGSMIDLAEARGWSSLRLNGTTAFKREAWLQATLRDIVVTGYRPDKLDKARLDELRIERASTPPVNTMTRDDDRKPGHDTSQPAKPSQSVPRMALSTGEMQFVKVMEAAMRHRGDREETIARAREIASDRLTRGRVHIGRLVEVGSAPYQDRPGEKDSPFVTLENDIGTRTKVWGVDLPRALQDANAKPGQSIAVAFEGRKPVEVDVAIKDAMGNTVRAERQTVERNSWRVVQLDKLREDAHSAILKRADAQSKAPGLNTFDRSAPPQTRPALKAPSRVPGRERTR